VNGDVEPSTIPTINTTALTGSPVGNYSITLSGASDPNYTINYVNGTMSVTSATLTITAVDKTKVYGAINPALTVSYTGLVNGDVEPSTIPTINTTALTGSPVGNYSITLSGASDPNYTISYIDGSLFVVKKQLIVLFDISNKTYDGNRIAEVIFTDNRLTGDELTVDKTAATFDTKDVGSGKTVTVTGVAITGTDAGNYSLTSSTVTGTASITAKQLAIADPTITKSKEYDKTLTANTTAGTLSGIVSVGSIADVVTVLASGTYSTSTVGTGKTITVAYTLDGADKDNYIKPVDKVYTDGEITAKQLTIADPTITKTKEYDKTVAVSSITAGTLSGVVTVGSVADVVTVLATGTYSTSTVGTGKTITVAYTLDGADKDNYIKPVDKVYTDGEITAKQLTISDPTITKSKVYDKTVTVYSITVGALSGVVTVGSIADVVTVLATGTYSTSTVGTGKTITVAYTLGGADKDNYIKPVSNVFTDGEITKKPIVVKAVALDKPYDGNKNASVTLSSIDILPGDDVIISKLLAEFDTKDPGVDKTVTVSGISIGGLDTLNYNLTNTTATAIASITPGTTSNVRPYVLPNAFTPNGDGKNDAFKVIVNDPSKVELKLFQIFSRNGKLMFSTSNISEGWDGRYNGVIQDMGVYFVKIIIKLKNENREVVETPSIYLLK
jgi:gliding motility-associated-like protein